MNINFSANSQQRIVTYFTCVWLIGSLIASAYFALWLFPEVYNNRTNATVQVYFQSKTPSNGSVFYWPNTEVFRRENLKNLSDRTHFYFSRCEILPISQRTKCDGAKNWRMIDPRELNCTDVVDCLTERYTLTDAMRQQYFVDLIPTTGNTISISDLPALSLSDLTGWGNAAKWPLFFVCLFLAIKLGRSFGEFVFSPYEKK